MSAATIDPYLADARRKGQLRGISATKPSLLLGTSIKIRTGRTGIPIRGATQFSRANCLEAPRSIGDFGA